MQYIRLGNVASVDASGVDKKITEGQTSVKLCNFTDVYYNWAITSRMSSSFMQATASEKEISKFTLKKGQVAITKDSETRNDIGNSAYIADNQEGVLLGYHCSLITPNPQKLDGSYLNALFHTSFAQKYFEANAAGSGQRYMLASNVIEDMKIPLPPIAEQIKIGKLFSRIDRKIELNKAINHNLPTLDHSSTRVRECRVA